ncbi:MAG: DUF4124 domain-containing protein [Pseudomonadales bacterium]|jgi:hypothetical protein|nr:DUF4124 domain-containing protein [Pseudomonadales bacterium]
MHARCPRPTVATVLTAVATVVFCGSLLLGAPRADAAPVYQTQDAQGRPVFSDRPMDGSAKRVEIREPNVFELPAAQPSADTGTLDDDELAAEPARASYSVFVTQPTMEEGVRANSGEVFVVARAEPAPREGDRFQLFVDGSPAGTSTDGTFRLEEMDRGEHRIDVRLIDPNGSEFARSDVVTFYVLRRSVLLPPAN